MGKTEKIIKMAKENNGTVTTVMVVVASVIVGLLVLIGVNSGFDEKESIQQEETGQTEPESSADAEKTLAAKETEKIATLNILMDEESYEYFDDKYYTTVLGSEISRDSIVTVTFVDTLDAAADNAWDVSKEQNGTVFAWTEPNTSNDQALDLFIGANGKIGAENCTGLFAEYFNLEAIEFNGSFDTSQVTSMGRMFSGCSSLTQLDVSRFDTSQVTAMSEMFYDCSSLTQLDVSNFDTRNVIDMSDIFEGCAVTAEEANLM